MSDFTEEQVDAAIALVNSEVAERLEYEETHEDAGDAYSHMPREGGFDYGDGPKRLVEFCKEHDIPGNAESVADVVLDNFRMVPGHMFSTDIFNNWDIFVVDSYHIQEHEIDLNYLVESGQISWELLMHISDDCDSYITGTGYAYVTTDSVWFAVIDAESLSEAVADTLGGQVVCELCEQWASESEAIHTEDGFTVGECCRDELRVTGYTTEHDSETFYHVN